VSWVIWEEAALPPQTHLCSVYTVAHWVPICRYIMHCTQWSRELARVGCDVTLTSWQQWRHSVQRCCCYDNGGGCLAEYSAKYSANEKRQRHDRCRGTIHVVHYSGQWAGTCPPKTAPSCWGNWTPSNAVMSHFEYMLNTCCPAPVSYLDTPFLCCLFLGLFLGSACRCVAVHTVGYSMTARAKERWTGLTI